jgi:hypothetical protein
MSVYFSGIEFNIRENKKMDDDHDELFGKKDLRRKKHKKRQHKEKDECTREGFKKMKDEIDELRRKELERARELEDLRKKIEMNEQSNKAKNGEGEKEKDETEYALGFDRKCYLSKGFIESAIWIKQVLAKNLMIEIERDENKLKFTSSLISKKSSAYLGYRACARFNRGEECALGKWHMTHKPDGLWTKHQSNQPPQKRTTERGGENVKRNELRLHVCTLCLEAFGTAIGHSVLECPWIFKKNWS